MAILILLMVQKSHSQPPGCEQKPVFFIMGFQLPFPQLVSESRISGCHQLRMGHVLAIKNSSPVDSRYMLVYIREDCAADVLKVPDPVEAILI